MTNEEILAAAKEAGLLHQDAKVASRIVFDFAAIIEKRTIEKCAAVCDQLNNHLNSCYMADESTGAWKCAAAIRALGEQ